MKVIFIFLIFTFPHALLAGENVEGCQKIIEENKDFTHCLSKIPNYPEPVHIYTPKNLNRSMPININIHFHGHNLPGYDHFDKKFGDYGDFLAKGKGNSVLIIPESTGNCATYDKYFKSSENTFNFVNDSKKLFLPLPTASLSLSGHSGAYRVLNSILGQPKLEENVHTSVVGVALFDATYGSTSNIENFAINKLKQGKPFLFFNSYVSGKNATAETLSTNLKQKFTKMSLVPDSNILEVNQGCLEKFNKNNINEKIDALSSPAFKYLIDSRFKFVPMPSSNFPKDTSLLDLHFGVLREHGLTEYFNNLNK